MASNNVSRRSFLAAGAIAAGSMAALGLSGCGGSSSNTAASNTGSSSSAASSGNELTGGCAYTSTTYSPVGNSSALMLPATLHVFEGLYDMDLSDYSTYAALADGEPKRVSPLDYKIKLRKDAKFSDGTPVTAKDVVNAFKANMAEGQLYAAFLGFISSVDIDGDDVVIGCSYAFDNLLKERLSVVKIFPASATDEELAANPIGSGPWMYDSLDGNEGGKIVFVPNPNYNGPKPADAEKMTWNVLVDETSRTTAMTEGTTMVMEAVPDANADAVSAAGATIDYIDGFGMPFLMFDTIKKPFDDYRVRQAFFYAIDVEKLISNQMAGHANAASCYLPESHPNYHEASTVFTYDPEKAKSLLAEAGVDSLDFTLRVNSNWVKALGAQIVEDLKAVGLNATLAEMTSAELFGDMDGIKANDANAYDVALTPGDPSCFGNDPDLLMSWFFDNSAWLDGRTCWAKASDGKCKELKKLLQKAREAAEADDQQEIWNKCYDMIAEQAVLYPLFHKQMATGYYEDKISGFKPISTTGLVFLDAKPVA